MGRTARDLAESSSRTALYASLISDPETGQASGSSSGVTSTTSRSSARISSALSTPRVERRSADDEDAREHRSDCARGVDHGAVQRNGGGHQVSAHDLRNEGRSCRDLIRDEQGGLAGEESAAREPVPCPVGYG